MNFQKITTEDIFSTSKRYKVPKYQRGYAWKEKIQIQDFWDDLQEIDNNNPLYFGTIILQKTEGDKSSNIFDIVDGQQRLTTLSLFFIACRNHAKKNNYAQAPHLPRLVATHDIARGGVLEPLLEAGVNVIEAYKYLVENSEYDGGIFPRNVDGRKAKILKSNYNFFMERISSLNEADLGDLLNNVLKNTFFLVIFVDESLQAFDIFERTNARGAPLNIADLLKNLLFSNQTEITNLTERWDRIILSSDVRLPRFLKYFDSQVNGHDTGKKTLFPHLRNQVRSLGPAKFMDEIEIFSNFYNSAVTYNFTSTETNRLSQSHDFDFLYGDEIFFKRIKRSLDALNLSRVQVPIPVIYAGLRAIGRFKSEDSKKLNELKGSYVKTLNLIECYHFINNGICTTPTNRSEQLYATEAKKLTEAKTVTEVKESLERVRVSLNKIGLADRESFIESFSQIVYSASNNKPLLVYIFDRFQCDSFEKTPSINLFEPQSENIINRTYEIEHIYPVSLWEGDEDTLNSIGNLLVLTHTTNRLVGNLKPAEKIVIYRNRDFDSLSAVRDFVDYFKQDKNLIFDESKINNRARILAEHAYDKIWNPWR